MKENDNTMQSITITPTQQSAACIDLKEKFGRRYRVAYEDSYFADPWLLIVPCRYGHIFPHGGNLLAASVDGHPNVAGVLRRLSCCQIHQDGDFGEVTVIFDVADFAKVARIIQPRRRRQVSAQERDRLRGMGYQKGAQAHVDVHHTLRQCVPAVQVDLGHLPLHQSPFDARATA